MKNLKKHLILLAVLCITPLILIGTIIYIIDPFFMYHKPLAGWNYLIDNQLEQNPGIAKHFEYDSVMLGSSMTTNFDTNLFNEKLDTEMVKLSYNAAYPADIDTIMKIVTDEKQSLEYAYLCIDIANYMREPGTLSHVYPKHLYDKNPFNDLKYLLNKDVLLTYVVGNYVKKENTPINEIYWHWPYMVYDRAHVLSGYNAPEMVGSAEQAESVYTLENLKTNLETYIIPYIESMPDTQWNIFFPPYSMLYWYDATAAGEAERRIDGIAYITERLGAYDNVRIHYFQNMEEWISDLNNYTDATHFSKQITDDMTDRLCSGTNEVDLTNYQEHLDTFKDFVRNFDYEAFVTP